jgi:hypothetical protein
MATAAFGSLDTASGLAAKRARLLAAIRFENERAMRRLARLERGSKDYRDTLAGIEERALEELRLRMSDFDKVGIVETD